MFTIAIIYLGGLALLIETAARAPELHWHD